MVAASHTTPRPALATATGIGAGGYGDATGIIYGALASAMEARETLTPSQWADKYRVIAEGTGPHPGPWKTDMAPYFREPMDAWADEHVRDHVWMFGSQMGKTEALINVLFYTMDVEPAWTMMAYPSASFAQDVLADRIMPNIYATTRILDRLRPGRADRKINKIRFDGGTLNLTGSGSDTESKGRPIGNLLFDEIDEMDPAWVANADQRTKAYGDDARRAKVSTPTFPGVGIHAEWQSSLQLEWSVPCPHCHEFIGLGFEQLKWGVDDTDENGKATRRTGSKCTPDEVEDTAHVVCPQCGAPIYEHHKPAMERAGVYLSEGQSAELLDASAAGPCADAMRSEDRADRSSRVVDGKVIVVHGERPRARKVGYRANSLHSLFLPWGKVARAFAEGGFVLTPAYVTGYLAQPWEVAGDKADVAELQSLIDRSDYRLHTAGQRGEKVPAPLPEGVRLLSLAVDIQADSVWYEFKGWGAHCRESWLAGIGSVQCPEGMDLDAAIGPLLARTFRTVDGRTLKPYVAAIDSGHRTADVYALCQQYRGGAGGGQKVHPVKGRWGATMALPWKMQAIDRFPDGRVMPHGLKLLEVNTDIAKSFVLGALKASASSADAVHGVGVDGARAEDLGVKHRVHLPGDTPGEYVRHLISEHRVAKSAKRTASQKRSFRHDDGFVWEMRQGFTRNEWLDTTCYQTVAMMAEGMGKLGRLQMDGLNERLVSPERVAPPLAGLEQRLSDIRAMRRRR